MVATSSMVAGAAIGRFAEAITPDIGPSNMEGYKSKICSLFSTTSFRINSFTKANSWGFFPSGKSKFKKGQFIDCFTVSPKEEMLIN